MTQKAPSSPSAASKASIAETAIAMGRHYHARGQIKQAEACYRQVLALEQDNFDALHLLGVVAFQTGHFEEAIKLIKRALRGNAQDPSMFVNLGLAYRRTNDDEKATAAYETALSIDPDFWDALYNLGKLHLDAYKFEQAIPLYERCIALRPAETDAHNNLGNAYKFKGEGDKAVAAYEQALRLSPNFAQAYGNIAAVFLDRGWHNAALAVMDKAVAIVPQPGELRFKRALMALRCGQLETGWTDYDSRFVAETERIPSWSAPPPFWSGEDLAGKSIVVRTEQGLGDEVLYSSMLPEVIARAGRCILECSPRMVPVFARTFPGAEVLRYKVQGVSVEPLEGVDYQISIGSLGKFFRRRFDQFPRHEGYIKADPERTEQLRARYQRMAPGNKVVGLSWRSKNERLGGLKSSDLAAWRPILTVPGVTFVNLQYGDCAEELAAVKAEYGVDVIQDDDVNALKSVDDFFAQVAAMDLVISTSNTTVHAAGSLNIPAWVMLVTGPGTLWYWFLDRTNSPWYPSLRLFRQPRENNGRDTPWWTEVVDLVGEQLRVWMGLPPGASI
ncbi:MAG: tetratricopeptide repeat protein [Rhodospirillaceae bacterium]|nr:tetratricopeptide repeat protein [Rhodospirillaceae bacterium]